MSSISSQTDITLHKANMKQLFTCLLDLQLSCELRKLHIHKAIVQLHRKCAASAYKRTVVFKSSPVSKSAIVQRSSTKMSEKVSQHISLHWHVHDA